MRVLAEHSEQLDEVVSCLLHNEAGSQYLRPTQYSHLVVPQRQVIRVTILLMLMVQLRI